MQKRRVTRCRATKLVQTCLQLIASCSLPSQYLSRTLTRQPGIMSSLRRGCPKSVVSLSTCLPFTHEPFGDGRTGQTVDFDVKSVEQYSWCSDIRMERCIRGWSKNLRSTAEWHYSPLTVRVRGKLTRLYSNFSVLNGKREREVDRASIS